MNRILAIARKEFIHITRDRRLLATVLLMPLIQLFLFSYALSFNVKNISTAVLNQDNSSYSREYLSALQQSNYFKVTENLTSMSQVSGVFSQDQASVVVIISPTFGSDIAAGRLGEVQLLIDGSDSSAQTAKGYLSALSGIFGGRVAISEAQAKGVSASALSGITASIRTWYNPEERSANYFIPGLIVILLTTVTIQQTALTLVREKENGTYEQLIVSPIHRIELMVGKIAPWALIGALDVIMVSLIGVLAFQIPFRGSVVLFGLGSLLYVICTLGLGLIVSARASSVETASQLSALLAVLPGFMLSGFIFPISNLPIVLQLISYVFPTRYFMVIVRTIFLKGGSFAILWPQFAALGVFAVAIVVLAAATYRERT
jgi:ABC-2 type transport system permease protein